MNRFQQDVRDFHEVMNQKIGSADSPQLADHKLRIDLIEEEARELCDAIRDDNLVEAADGACDLLYVVLGTFVSAGVDLQPLWDEVHRTNMLKAGGPVGENGKQLKPEGWKPPRVAKMIQRLKERGDVRCVCDFEQCAWSPDPDGGVICLTCGGF
jgi:predicted HAD superfamily Cof-like phosphohydrolase